MSWAAAARRGDEGEGDVKGRGGEGEGEVLERDPPVARGGERHRGLPRARRRRCRRLGGARGGRLPGLGGAATLGGLCAAVSVVSLFVVLRRRPVQIDQQPLL